MKNSSRLGRSNYLDDNMKPYGPEKGSADAVLMDEIVARYNIEANDKGYKVLMRHC